MEADVEDADGDLAQERNAVLIDKGLRAVRAVVASGAILPTERFCQDCDEEIPAARVQAAPWTTRCVVCQSTAERH